MTAVQPEEADETSAGVHRPVLSRLRCRPTLRKRQASRTANRSAKNTFACDLAMGYFCNYLTVPQDNYPVREIE